MHLKYTPTSHLTLKNMLLHVDNIVCCVDTQLILTVLAVLRYREGISVGSVYGSGADSYTDTGASPF